MPDYGMIVERASLRLGCRYPEPCPYMAARGLTKYYEDLTAGRVQRYGHNDQSFTAARRALARRMLSPSVP